ncbi:DNA endonuclease SmrA [Alteromonas sp.]|nr:DNA endonuclease SmrA [Alteromonas sp.]
MNYEVEDSFFEEMKDVKPIKTSNTAQLHTPESTIEQKRKRAQAHASIRDALLNPLSMESAKPIPPDEFILYQQPGIQDGVFKKLRLGKYPIENKISLKGMTLKESCDRIYQSIKQNHKRGVRALLIQHGRGENSKPFPGLKKSYVNQWLRELDEVIAFHTAQPIHGGFGATYVLLKKHPDQKLINRESNSRNKR